jgi:hypothetical protein
MSKLARRLGISDVGLAKACRRADIPLPGVGYWAKLQYGKKVPRIPLPLATLKTPAVVEWTRWALGRADQMDPLVGGQPIGGERGVVDRSGVDNFKRDLT